MEITPPIDAKRCDLASNKKSIFNKSTFQCKRSRPYDENMLLKYLHRLGFGLNNTAASHITSYLKLVFLYVLVLFSLSLAPVASASPTDYWDVEFYAGHFGVVNATNPDDHPSADSEGEAGSPELYGSGKTEESLSYSFNREEIDPDSEEPSDNPWNILKDTLASASPNPATGAYPDTNYSGTYSYIFKREAPLSGFIQIGKVGSYFDDFAELFVNGVMVGSINRFTESLDEDEIIIASVLKGDEIEMRFTNGADLGGFVFSTEFYPEQIDLTIKKTSTVTDTDADGQTGPGDKVSYSFLVTAPSSNNIAIKDLVINDPSLAALSPAPVITCPTTPLAPGKSATCTASDYVVTDTDLAAGSIDNEATVSGTSITEESSALSPSDTNTVKVGTVDAIAESFPVVNATTGANNLNVLSSDKLDDNAVSISEVDLTVVDSDSELSLDPNTGLVTVAPNTTAGTYTVEYKICEKVNPEICDTVTETVVVAATITPDDESGTAISGVPSTPIASVIPGDTINGQPATLGSSGNATISKSGTWPVGFSLNPTTGAVSTNVVVN